MQSRTHNAKKTTTQNKLKQILKPGLVAYYNIQPVTVMGLFSKEKVKRKGKKLMKKKGIKLQEAKGNKTQSR